MFLIRILYNLYGSSSSSTAVPFQKWHWYSTLLVSSLLLTLFVVKCRDKNDANSPLNWTHSALSADVPQVTDGFRSCFRARPYWIVFRRGRIESWRNVATTVKFCWRSRCCQSCVALLETRVCSARQWTCTPCSWNSPAPSAGNTGFYLSRSVAVSPDLNPVDYGIWGLM